MAQGLSFIFDAQKGETPASIAQKRALVAQIMGSQNAPSTLGAGFSALGDGIVANVTGRRADAAQEAGQSQVDAFRQMLTGSYGSPGATATTGAPASVPQGADAASIRQGLIDRGLPEHVADGFLMNFQDESGLNPGINEQNPTVAGSRGGYGLYQLTGPRRVAYEQYAQQRGIDPSDTNAQLDFMMSELQGPEANAAKSIMAAPDAGSAAAAIARDFLRPAPENLAPRVAKYTAGGQQQAPVQVASLDQSIGMPQQQAQMPPIVPAGGPQTAQMQQQAPSPEMGQTADAGLSMQQLMQAAGNPFVMAQYGDVINSMISQQMQQQDPAYQQSLRAGDLGIQKSELEIDAMRHPPAPAPAPVKYEVIGGQVVAIDPNSNSASSIGSFGQPATAPRPMTPEDRAMWGIPASDTTPYYLDENGQPKAIGGGGVTVNTGDRGQQMGTIPAGMAAVSDPSNPSGFRLEAIPGGPAAAEAANAAQRADAQAGMNSTVSSIVTQDIDRALSIIDSPGMLPTTGFGADWVSNVGGTPGNDLRNLINTVKANTAFDQLQQMRAASPTGGALGGVSEGELTLLEAAKGALEQSQSPQQLKDNLVRVQNIYLDIVHGKGNGPERKKPSFEQQGDQPAGQSTPQRVETPEQYQALPAGTPYLAPDGTIRTKR